MDLEIKRRAPEGGGIVGQLSIGGVKECFTLENASLSIPAGSYQITLYNSPHAGHIVPLLQNVPGRSSIEIHCGNVPEDSKGCILVGQSCTSDTVINSRLAFDHLFPQIQTAINNGELVTLTIS